jgi:hypothetical protein
MASNGRIFFAGVGTTFVILAIGFGGGLMLAKSALHDPAAIRASYERPPGVRVVLPPSAEPALQVTAAVPTESIAQPVQNVQAPVIEKRVDIAESKNAEKALKAERKRYAERKAKRTASARPRQPIEPQQQPGILAFGDQPRNGFFGN